jgi:PKD repeat protein
MPVDTPDGYQEVQPASTVNLESTFGQLWHTVYTDALAAGVYTDHTWTVPNDGFIHMIDQVFAAIYADVGLAVTVYLNGDIIAPLGGMWSCYGNLGDNPSLQLIYGDVITTRVQNLDVGARTINTVLSGTKFIRPADFGHPPYGKFSANSLTPKVGATVTFTDESLYTPTIWDWNFSDYSAHATTQNPTHVFYAATTMTIILTVANIYGYDVVTKVAYIIVSPTVDFTTYTEVDTGGHIAVVPTALTVTNLTSNETTRVYKDYGAGGLNSINEYISNSQSYNEDNSYSVMFELTNDATTTWPASGTFLLLMFSTTAGIRYATIEIVTNGSIKNSQSIVVPASTQLCYHINRGLNSNTCIVSIYTDIYFTVLLGTITATHADLLNATFRYIYATGGLPFGQAAKSNFGVYNMSLI